MAWRLTEDMFAQFHKLAFSYRVPPFVYLFVAAHTTLAYCLEEMLLERTNSSDFGGKQAGSHIKMYK